MNKENKHIEKKKSLAPKLRFMEFDNSLQTLKLDELVSFKSGGTPSKDNPLYWGGDIPWISAASMNGKYYSTSERTITKEGLKNGSKLAPKGNLLLLVRGSMLFNKIPIGIAGVDVAFNQDLKALATKENSNTDFIYQWFFSKQNLLLDKVVGTGIGAGKLDTADLKNLDIYLPTLPEQQKIASFLSAVDEKIQQLTHKKELLEQYKKGVMQKLFSGKPRFKDENGKAFPKWEEKKLGEICDVRDGTHDSPKYSNEGYPLITSKNLKVNGTIDFENVNLISEQDYIAISKRSGVSKGDILFGMIGTIGNPVIINKEGFAIKNVALIKQLTELKNIFLIHYLKSKFVLSQFNQFHAGGIQKFISLGLIRNLIINTPCIEEQKKIADYLSNLDHKIESVTKQITQTQIFKKGLLQQMFV